LPFAALSQIETSFDLRLDERFPDELMRDLHAATAWAIAGFAEAADPELEPLFPEVVVVAEADVLDVEADVLLAGALLAVIEDELLPQPAAAMPTAAATNNHTSGLRIIVLSPCVACG
jgi:hypothetical protein